MAPTFIRDKCGTELTCVMPTFRGEAAELGIDEAGRGPVFGPMVYGACFSPLSWHAELEKQGFNDSKQLKESTRETFFEEMANLGEEGRIGYIIHSLSAEEISAKMLRKHGPINLNAQSHDCAIGMIRRAVSAGVNVKKVYVDTVGDPQAYESKLKKIFPKIDVTVAKKADSLFPIVSAASILAKVTRDRQVRALCSDGSLWTDGHALWQHCMTLRPADATAAAAAITHGSDASQPKKDGVSQKKVDASEPKKDFVPPKGVEAEEVFDVGSGYPGDPRTKHFLDSRLHPVFGFPRVMRFAWSTVVDAVQARSGAVVFDWHDQASDGESDDGFVAKRARKTGGQQTITAMFASAGRKAPPRPKLWTHRGLSLTANGRL